MAPERKFRHTDATFSAMGGVEVTPSDTIDLPFYTRAVWVGTGGNLEYIMHDGQTHVMKNIQDGTMLDLCLSRIKAGSTSATDIIAYY